MSNDASRAQDAGRIAQTFRSLRVRNFRLFVGGQILSATGTWMQFLAQPLLVLKLTGSGTALGIDSALTFLPIMLAGAWGGVVADRFDNRRIQIFTQVAFGALAMTLFVLTATGVVRVWMVYALSFLTGCVTAVDMPTRQSFYLEMVGPEQLTNAMSLNTGTFMGARMIGPAIAAALISSVGLAAMFLINGITYLFVIAALLAMRPSELRSRERVRRRRGQVREGIQYAWRDPALRLPILVMAAVFMFAFNFTVLLPLLALRTFKGGPGTLGFLLSLFGAGSLVGALAMAAWSSKANVRYLTLWAIALGGASAGVAVAPVLPVEWILMPLLGVAAISFAITANSTLQLNSSDAMRGRVMALYTVVFLGSTPIGGPIAGWVGEHLGTRIALGGGAVIALVAGLLGLAAVRRAPTGLPAMAPAPFPSAPEDRALA